MMILCRPRVRRMRPREVIITGRQAQCLDALCDGLTNAQIANELFVTEGTVKTTMKRLYKALGASDRAHAVGLVLTGRVVVLVRDPGGVREGCAA